MRGKKQRPEKQFGSIQAFGLTTVEKKPEKKIFRRKIRGAEKKKAGMRDEVTQRGKKQTGYGEGKRGGINDT